MNSRQWVKAMFANFFCYFNTSPLTGVQTCKTENNHLQKLYNQSYKENSRANLLYTEMLVLTLAENSHMIFSSQCEFLNLQRRVYLL